MSKRKPAKGRKQRRGSVDVRLTASEAETDVTPEALDRALALLAKWALKRGQKVLEEAGIELGNRVTGGGIKGCGGKNGSN